MNWEWEQPRNGPLASFKTPPQYGPTRRALQESSRPVKATVCKGPAGHRQGPVGLDRFFKSFFITYRRCEPVIYENRGEKDYRGRHQFSSKLTWPQKNRMYYRQGDIIFLQIVYQKNIPNLCPKLSRKAGKKSLLENIIDSEILGMNPGSKYGQVITKIEPIIGKPGYGIVETKPMLFFGETGVFLEDETPNRYTARLLNEKLTDVKLSNTSNTILPFIEFTSEIMMMVLTGGARAVAKKTVKVFVVRQAGIKAVTHVARKQAVQSILRASGKALAEASVTFGIVFIKATGDKQEEALRAAAGKKVDYKTLQNAIRAGSEAFAATIINKFLGGLIGAAKISPAKTYISEKITALFTTDLVIGVLIPAYRKAALDRDRKRTGTKEQAGINMGKEMRGFFINNVKGILKDVVNKFF